MGKRPNFIILACLIISAISILFVLFTRGQEPKKPLYTPPPAAAKPSNESIVGSPDGKWTLSLKEARSGDTVTYKFLVINESDGSQKEIYTKTVSTGTTLSIPANTFSPDDKYVFLKETAPTGVSYLVLSVSGSPVGKDGQTPEIVSLFTAKHENYKITEATGWGGMNLIVFNTDKVEGGIGPSFWFEVPSGAFIQLSNRFN